MALNKRILRIIKENLVRYIGVLLLIILGSFTFILVSGLTQNMAAMVDTFIEENVQEDLYFAADKIIYDIELLEKESNALIEGYMSYDSVLSDSLTLRLFSKTEKVNIPSIAEGRALSQPGDILLDPAFAKANGYPVGSQIEAMGKTFTVVGLAHVPQYIYPVKNVNDMIAMPENFGIGIILPEEFNDFDNASIVYSVKFSGTAESINKQAIRLRSSLMYKGVQVSDWLEISNNKRAMLILTSIQSLQAMASPISIAMFLLSCLIIGIMIWRTIKQESVIIGTLYAQGYRRCELIRHYMILPIVLAFIGGVIGSLLALPSIAPSVMGTIEYFSIPAMKIKFDFLDLLIGIFMPVLFLCISSYFVIRSILKKSPADLMKGSEQKTKVNALERAFKLERFKFSTKFRLREQLRSISRLLLLILGIASASVLMLFGLTIMNSYNYVFNDSITEVYKFEYEYAFKDFHDEDVPGGVEVFTNGRFYPQNNDKIEFYINGIEPDSKFIFIEDMDGNQIPNNQVNITRALAERLDINEGDTVNLINKQDGKSYSFTIDAIADSYAAPIIYIPINEYNEKLGIPGNSYLGLWSNEKLDIPGDQLSGTKSISEISGAMTEMIKPLAASMVVISIIACIVALIILYLVISLIIEEGRKTISLFQVFGYKQKEIRSLILNSPTFAIVFGYIISIPIMIFSMDTIYGYVAEKINIVIPTIINPIHVIGCFVLIITIYQISKLLSIKKVNSIPMSEALKDGAE